MTEIIYHRVLVLWKRKDLRSEIRLARQQYQGAITTPKSEEEKGISL
jgi:hypothetical protein